jgi:hypothetical protein
MPRARKSAVAVVEPPLSGQLVDQGDETDTIAADVVVPDRPLDEYLAEAAAEQAGGAPRPIMAGTFAVYPTPEGGAVFVMDMVEAPSGPGTHRIKATPGIMRAISAAAGGGSKAAVIKALIGGLRGRQ